MLRGRMGASAAVSVIVLPLFVALVISVSTAPLSYSSSNVAVLSGSSVGRSASRPVPYTMRPVASPVMLPAPSSLAVRGVPPASHSISRVPGSQLPASSVISTSGTCAATSCVRIS